MMHPDAQKDDEEEAEARFSSEFMSGGEFVLPCDSLSALAEGNELDEQEDGDGAHGLQGIIELEFLSGNVLALLWLWWCWTILTWVWSVPMDHFVGGPSSIELPVNGTGETDATKKNQSA